MNGMMCNVYRRPGNDCTNGGVTSLARCPGGRALLVGLGVPQLFEPTEGEPTLMLVEARGGLIARPADPLPAGHVGWMSGGNFIYTSDSRFPSRQPIPVHDRSETVEQNAILSR